MRTTVVVMAVLKKAGDLFKGVEQLREKDMQAKLACALCTASWSTLQHCLGEAGQAQETAQESVEGTR